MTTRKEWSCRPTTGIDGVEMLTIYRGRKHVATLLFAARSGEILDELVATVERLWDASNG